MYAIYLALPITGRDFDTVVSAIHVTKERLERCGFMVMHPMTGKGYLRTEVNFKAHGYSNPASTNHAIVERDQWMVRNADVALFDFTDALGISIGMTMELGWASINGVHTVGVLPEVNPHRHAFILEALDVIFPSYEEAMQYLEKLNTGEM